MPCSQHFGLWTQRVDGLNLPLRSGLGALVSGEGAPAPARPHSACLLRSACLLGELGGAVGRTREHCGRLISNLRLHLLLTCVIYVDV